MRYQEIGLVYSAQTRRSRGIRSLRRSFRIADIRLLNLSLGECLLSVQ